jgi:hypothetical protein
MNRLQGRILLLAASVLACIAAQVPSGWAKVHVDPNGPAGQQYALPLDSARGEAAGNSAAGVPGSIAKAPLFGQGIKPSVSQAGHRQGEKAKSNGGGIDAKGYIATAGSGGGSTMLWVLGVVAAVVMVGSATGLVARRRLAGEPPG